MQKITDVEIIEYFRGSLEKNFIQHASKDFPDKNIRVADIFAKPCPIMVDRFDQDVSKAYSGFQYLEGCLLVEEIFMRLLERKPGDFQIVFALPNDELKYYKDSLDSFQKDVQFLISKRCEFLNISNVYLQIQFLAFQYGTAGHHRPYNAPGPVFKANRFSYEHVVGDCVESFLTLGDKYATMV
jgi:hypothetical protein